MKVMPILHSDGQVIPYEMVKQHEKQVMINHGGQTVEKICERGGLDWVELYCVLKDKPFNKTILPEFAMYGVLDKIYKFYGNPTTNKTPDYKLNLRPCIVKLPHDRNHFSVDAYFHRWCDRCKMVEQSHLVGGGPGGLINYVVGIIEYEDGTIDECDPKNIKFTDRR